jgi:apolipoprotein N-acyltransferase
MPAGLALFAAVSLGLAGWLWTSSSLSRIFLLAATWVLGEWLRGNLFTGFPWNLMGYVWAGHTEVAQAASIIGSYGLSFLTITILSSVALFAEPKTDGRWKHWHLPSALLTLLVVIWVGGAVRTAGADNEPGVSGVKLRIVQPGTRIKDRRDQAKHSQIWLNLLNMSTDARAKGVTHIIWPEAAPPQAIPSHVLYQEEIAELLDPGMSLLTGAIRVEWINEEDYNLFNGFVVFDDEGRQQSTYDKHHLVPFGEYLPFRSILSAIGLRQIADGVGNMKAGSGPATVRLVGAPPFSPVICYEMVFPGEVTLRGERPGWIVNVTDDDWFGDSIGPRQHLAIARMRSVEENLPTVRVANSGISALIDRFGRVRQSVPLHEAGVIDAPLPPAGPASLYSRLGDWPVLLLSLIILGVFFRFVRFQV